MESVSAIILTSSRKKTSQPAAATTLANNIQSGQTKKHAAHPIGALKSAEK